MLSPIFPEYVGCSKLGNKNLLEKIPTLMENINYES